MMVVLPMPRVRAALAPIEIGLMQEAVLLKQARVLKVGATTFMRNAPQTAHKTRGFHIFDIFWKIPKNI